MCVCFDGQECSCQVVGPARLRPPSGVVWALCLKQTQPNTQTTMAGLSMGEDECVCVAHTHATLIRPWLGNCVWMLTQKVVPVVVVM